ncbi:MAG TPA: hypothetical protein VFP68_05440, partial [Burkholderiaceae bacterium]|nr:hypothetical protein [Burkholderiaceae bacterium]
HGRGWDHFLAGRAVFAITWSDLGALAQGVGNKVRGKTGAAPPSGTHEYYDIAHRAGGARPPASTRSAIPLAPPVQG